MAGMPSPEFVQFTMNMWRMQQELAQQNSMNSMPRPINFTCIEAPYGNPSGRYATCIIVQHADSLAPTQHEKEGCHESQ